MLCKVLMFQPIYHVSVSPTDGNGPTQGHRKTLTRVVIGFLVHVQWDVTFLCVWIVFAALQVKLDV